MVATTTTQRDIKAAIRNVQDKGWSNGMATEPETVEFEGCYLKVIRKCGNLDLPEILLFKCIPKNGYVAGFNYDPIANDIQEALDLYGDVELSFNESDTPIKTLVINNMY